MKMQHIIGYIIAPHFSSAIVIPYIFIPCNFLSVIGFSCIFSQPPLITLTQKPYTNSMLASQTFIPACIQFDVYYQCLLG